MVVEGDYLCCVLSGILHNRTWLQFEGAQFHFSDPAMLWANVMHSVDFLMYVANFRAGAGQSGMFRLGPTQNVGPFGMAPFTDSHPLRADSLRPTSEACPEVCPEFFADAAEASAPTGKVPRRLRLGESNFIQL